MFEKLLSDKIRSYVRNITLLHVSADDAWVDSKLQGIDQDFKEVMDAHAFGNQEEKEDNAGANDRNIGSRGEKLTSKARGDVSIVGSR